MKTRAGDMNLRSRNLKIPATVRESVNVRL